MEATYGQESDPYLARNHNEKREQRVKENEFA